jgi:hypothetical protein
VRRRLRDVNHFLAETQKRDPPLTAYDQLSKLVGEMAADLYPLHTIMFDRPDFWRDHGLSMTGLEWFEVKHVATRYRGRTIDKAELHFVFKFMALVLHYYLDLEAMTRADPFSPLFRRAFLVILFILSSNLLHPLLFYAAITELPLDEPVGGLLWRESE